MGYRYPALPTYAQQREKEMGALSTQPGVLGWNCVRRQVGLAITGCWLQSP